MCHRRPSLAVIAMKYCYIQDNKGRVVELELVVE